jgi:DNA replication protein DnaD
MAGNQNSGKRKDKLFHMALMLKLKELEPDDNRGLRRIALNLIEMAESKDMQAIKELADRVDGKVAQAIVGDDDDAAIRIDGLALLLQAIDGKTRSV